MVGGRLGYIGNGMDLERGGGGERRDGKGHVVEDSI